VLSATALVSFMSVWKAAALAFAELGLSAFFLIGVAGPSLGGWTPWFVLAACCVGAFVRTIDIESWALFVPGGLVGRARQVSGPKAAGIAAATVLTERFLLAALACAVVGHYTSFVAAAAIEGWRPLARFDLQEFPILMAVALVGLLWIRTRLGLELSPTTQARGVWVAIGLLALTTGWAAWTCLGRAPATPILPSSLPSIGPLTALFGLALASLAIGGGDSLSREAHEFPQPRVQGLRRTGLLVIFLGLAVIAAPLFLFDWLIPIADWRLWAEAPLVGLAQHLAGGTLAALVGTVALITAAVLMLVPAARAALADAEQTLRRLAVDRVLPEGFALPHPRFGTMTRAIDLAAAAVTIVILFSGGQVEWLGRAYAFALAATLLIRIAVLVQFRRTRPGPRPFKAPFNLQLRQREWPVGLLGAGALIAAAAVAMIIRGDVPALVAASLSGGTALFFIVAGRRVEASVPDDLDSFELLPTADLSLGQVDAMPGNVLVPVRSPHSLAHVAGALQAAGDRDVVVMTVRLVGTDGDAGLTSESEPTPAERQLFSQVGAMAERYGKPVRLLIVPAHNVFDAVVATVLRLRSSEVYVGESATLSADDQARLLGDAWESVDKAEDLKVRLVIHHHSGRTDSYHIGAHPPSLSPGDLDLIHRLWLDATKAVGPHVHHHDVVRAALKQMEQQLNGPNRDDAVAALREVARPADELAAAVHARDFSRLRDITRNHHAGDLATTLTALSIEDQVVAFRVLPRKDASAVFEYLPHEAQEALLKALAKEDVAALMNNMAPDDRTMFLEELPAAATRQLLTLLTPAERSVALSLLGYPESSIGRLMTPHYVAVREPWTIREVLDYVRTHGQDSETLNVIYVVDEHGLLIDDIHIRELLLTSPDTKIADLMDRHFVALKATDDQQTAVEAFRKYDRTALPVTDTGGMLIGIVTIDDVLDVAEAEATEDIQRIGGSEALDEPYMTIAFQRMIQKRAGWLTALFLGEMLTATAMNWFSDEIAKALVLVQFIPLIISSGGNSGSQASTLVIRALALGEIGLRDWWRVMRREVFAGLALGSILGSIGVLRITLWSVLEQVRGVELIYGSHWPLVAVTVGLALVGVVLWGTLVGSLLPLLLRRLGFDPATSSAPFVATLVDVTGLVIYFSVAMATLHGTLLKPGG
jgi:magnesium transporter